MSINTDDIDRLAKFCNKYGIDNGKQNNVGWYLTSYWDN